MTPVSLRRHRRRGTGRATHNPSVHPLRAAWHDHPEYGRRLIVYAHDEYRLLKVVLQPTDPVVAPLEAADRSVLIVYVDELDLYGWQPLSASGQVLAASRSYPTKAAAVEAARAVIRASTNVALIDRTAS